MLGPLAVRAEPHGYDLCTAHGRSLSAPLGWEVIRLANEELPRPSTDDLLALADAVREVGLSYDPIPSPAEERPSRLVRLLFYSHPPIRERIDAARAFTRT